MNFHDDRSEVVLWWVGAIVASFTALAIVVWLTLCVIDWTVPRLKRRYLRWWWARRDHGTWLSLRYRLGCRLLLPLIEKQYHAYGQAQKTMLEDGNTNSADHREWMRTALSSLVRSAKGA